ncbi:MAG: hypothetical protein A2X46_04040 [Lentisphaerae bacterium GWF2_57_35]|nr:MAG: hypothetical protein A2X46_04040 [Lentisphaerae bacterium GWF2_57_35]
MKANQRTNNTQAKDNEVFCAGREAELQRLNEQLRNLAARLQSVQEEESKRIAGRLHDELGQALTALKMDVIWLLKRLTPADAELQEKAAGMKELIDRSIKTIRSLSTELHPSILDDLGLAAAMQWYGKEFEQRTGIRLQLAYPPAEAAVESAVANTVFRVFQAALTNAAQHAGASAVSVTVQTVDGRMDVTIRDNGRGISLEALQSARSIGLIQMRERVFSHNGTLEIQRADGGGTEIKIGIPLPLHSKSTTKAIVDLDVE